MCQRRDSYIDENKSLWWRTQIMILTYTWWEGVASLTSYWRTSVTGWCTSCKKEICMMLIFRRKLRTVFNNLIMILMISGVEVTKQYFPRLRKMCSKRAWRVSGWWTTNPWPHIWTQIWNYSYFIFGGSQFSWDVFGYSQVPRYIMYFAVCT